MERKKKQSDEKGSSRKLRAEAEKKVARSADKSAPLKKHDLDKLVHELQIHQVELELQNEDLRTAQEQIAKSRNDYADLYDFAPVGYLTFNGDALITGVNLTGAALLGVERQKLLKRRFRAFVAPADAEHWDRHFVSVLQQGEKQSCDLLLRRKDGSTLHARLDSIRVEMDDGTCIVRTAMSDITVQKQAEEVLHLSEERYKNLFNNNIDGLCVIDDTMKILMLNQAAASMFGFASAEEVFGVNPFDFIPQEERERVLETVTKDMFEHDRKQINEFRLINRAGKEVWLSAVGTVIEYQGKPAGLVSFKDITERTATKLEYQTILRTALDGFWLTDMQGHFLDVNQSYCSLTGYSYDELMNMAIRDIEVIEQPEDVAKRIKKIKEVGFDRFETRHRRKDGGILDIEISVNYLQIDNGRLCVFARDITHRKQVEEALQKSEAQYRLLAEHTTDVIWLSNRDLKTIYISPSVQKLRGFSPQEIMEMPLEKQVTPESLKFALELFSDELPRVEADPDYNPILALELEYTCKNGTTVWAENKFSVIRDENGRPLFILGEARDITERKQAEDALRESEAQYRLLAEHTTDVICLVNRDLKVTYMSPNVQNLRGFTPEEILEMPLGKILTPESSKFALELFVKELPRVDADPGYNPLHILELEYYRRGGTTFWAETKFSVIRDENGKSVSVLCEARDITERREAERKLEQSLAALEKTMGDTVIAISKIVEMKDPFTAGHQIRVAQLAGAMAKKMNLPDEQVTYLNTAATIHDIGKIYVPSDILSKPGKLGAIEFQIIQAHVQGSYDILKEIDFSGPIAQIVYQHHERLDGSGYPRGLKGSDILPEAKILIVADVVEAMSSHRPYRAALGIEKALEEISLNRGSKYDEAAVDACLQLFSKDQFEFRPM